RAAGVDVDQPVCPPAAARLAGPARIAITVAIGSFFGMPLAGTLQEYALADLLRLIESGQRTGALFITGGTRQAALYFSGGQWLLGERVGSALTLVHRLVRGGRVTEDEVLAAVGVPLEQAGELPETQVVGALVNAGILPDQQVRAFCFDDATSLLAVLLAWQQGEFAFDDTAQPPRGRVCLPLPVGMLLSQVARMPRSHPLARPARPLTRDSILQFAELDPAARPAVQLRPEQWRLLTAVDGEAPLWILATRIQLAESGVLQMAAGLVAEGILEIA